MGITKGLIRGALRVYFQSKVLLIKGTRTQKYLATVSICFCAFRFRPPPTGLALAYGLYYSLYRKAVGGPRTINKRT